MNTLVGAGPLHLATAGSNPIRVEIDDTRLADGPHREILLRHRPNQDGTACSGCGFAYTEVSPLCPHVADTLREMAAIDTRPQRQKSSLGGYSTSRLRVMAREHVGEGRCRRCGFVYSGRVRLCPTARRIAAELESRSKAPVTQPRAGQGLCAGKGSAWNVTGHEAAPWKRAMAACSICPLLAQCEAELESRLAAGAKISEQIIAGRLFTVRGAEVTAPNVDEFADHRGRPKKKRTRPTRRTAAQAPAVPAVGRQLALFEGAAA